MDNKRLKRLKRAAGFVVLLAPGYIMLRAFEYSQVYHPDRTLTAAGGELGRKFEDVTFATSDGVQLNGWFFPATNDSPQGRLAVLFCHGNAGNISHRLELCQALLETGVSVFLFDYRGYGRSEGRPSEQGTYLDAQAAYHWLAHRGFAGIRIIAYGESLGGGVASEVAMREPLAGLVLQSTFTSIPDVGAELFPWFPVRWLSTIKYNTRARLPHLKTPVLVMHSRADSLIPFHHGERNFASANPPKAFCELKGGHNDALTDRPAFIAGFNRLLRIIETNSADPGLTPVASPGGAPQ